MRREAAPTRKNPTIDIDVRIATYRFHKVIEPYSESMRVFVSEKQATVRVISSALAGASTDDRGAH
jgi:hypothetical protein